MLIEGGLVASPPPLIVEEFEGAPLPDKVGQMALVLDTIVPNWHKGINLGKLDLAHARTCVLGQARYRKYFLLGESKVGYGRGLDIIEKWKAAHPDRHVPDDDVFLWNHYRDAWEREILSRRAA